MFQSIDLLICGHSVPESKSKAQPVEKIIFGHVPEPDQSHIQIDQPRLETIVTQHLEKYVQAQAVFVTRFQGVKSRFSPRESIHVICLHAECRRQSDLKSRPHTAELSNPEKIPPKFATIVEQETGQKEAESYFYRLLF